MQLLCSISMPDGPPHAVALSKMYPRESRDHPPEMVALNSWGQRQPETDVTADNFQYALHINTHIVECHEGSRQVPLNDPSLRTTDLYDCTCDMVAPEMQLEAAQRALEEERAARLDAERRARELEQRLAAITPVVNHWVALAQAGIIPALCVTTQPRDGTQYLADSGITD